MLNINKIKDEIAAVLYENESIKVASRKNPNVVYPRFDRLTTYHSDNYRLQAEAVLLYLLSNKLLEFNPYEKYWTRKNDEFEESPCAERAELPAETNS